MAVIQHGFFPRSMMNMDDWLTPFGSIYDMDRTRLSTLDMFDPFDALDRTLSRNMQWLTRPDFLLPVVAPKVPQKYRITLDTTGYKPKSIKTEWKDHLLTVSAKEENHDESGDFSVREFKKTYSVPETAETDKMVSFVTSDGHLVVEVPLAHTGVTSRRGSLLDLFPQVVEDNGAKMVKMRFSVPGNISPEHIDINVKDRCLIIKAEEKKTKPDGVSTFHYYKKTTLPENTNFEALKCSFENNEILVTAPLLNHDWTATKKITLETSQPAVAAAAAAAEKK